MRLNGHMATEVAQEAFLPALKYGASSPTRCELSALGLRHGKDLVGDFGVEALQPRKLLRLGHVQLEEWQLESLGKCCHIEIIMYLASLGKIMERGGAQSAPAIHPATKVAGFLAKSL